jgi:3-oxoacid CoA-transferase subunit A
MELAYKADFAIVKHGKGHEAGNLILKEPHVTLMHAWLVLENHKPRKNFYRRFVRTNEIHIPGIMVQRIFQGEKFEKNRAKNG